MNSSGGLIRGRYTDDDDNDSKNYLDEMVNAYMECIDFTESERLEGPSDDIGFYGFATEMDNQARRHCSDFLDACIDSNLDFLGLMGDPIALSPVQMGHDFWFTRNRHGAGFWDRGLGDVGEKLTDIAQSMGEQDVYVADDGWAYFA